MKSVQIDWKGGMKFDALAPSGHSVLMDAYPEVGGDDAGVRPLELVAVALGGCTAMDVISILRKKRQTVTGYQITVEYATREGEYPHPITSMRVRHVVSGPDLDPAAVERAVQLSDDKYCSVAATLRQTVDLQTEWVVKNTVETK